MIRPGEVYIADFDQAGQHQVTEVDMMSAEKRPTADFMPGRNGAADYEDGCATLQDRENPGVGEVIQDARSGEAIPRRTAEWRPYSRGTRIDRSRTMLLSRDEAIRVVMIKE